jgi:tetratricopeptide (TPR) repeat protein
MWPDPGLVSKTSQSNGAPPPEQSREAIGRARQAAQRRDWLEAWRCWDDVRSHSPLYAPAYLGASNALREARRYDEAESVLSAGAELLPGNEQIAIARGWLALERHDWQLALSRWEDLRARFPENPWCYLGNIHALRALGRSDEEETLLAGAEAALVKGKQRGLDAEATLRLEFAIAKVRLDWPTVRRCGERIVAEASPSAQVLLALAQACWHLGDRDEADRIAVRALSSDPTLAEAVLVRAWVATERGDGETAVSCYRTLVELNPGTVRWSLKLVQLLTWLGHVKEAVREFENIRTRWPNDPMVRMFLRNYAPASTQAFGSEDAANRPAEGDPDRAEWDELQAIAGRAPRPEDRLRPLVEADPERDVLIAAVKKADAAVLVFTGGTDAVSMPLPVFDRYLATLNVTAIYLKDFKKLRYLLGIESLSPNYEGTLAGLRDMLSRLGVQRVCTLGNCEGGFAAIRYGIELGADRIVTFGAPTYSPDDSFTQIEQARNFMRNRLAATVPGDMIDLKPFLEARRYPTQIEFFYEEEDPRDRIHALHLSGLPGIALHPQPGLNHTMLRRQALSNQDFRGWLGKLLGVEPAASG